MFGENDHEHQPLYWFVRTHNGVNQRVPTELGIYHTCLIQPINSQEHLSLSVSRSLSLCLFLCLCLSL